MRKVDFFLRLICVGIVDRAARSPAASVFDDEREVDGQMRKGKIFKTRRKQREHKRDV